MMASLMMASLMKVRGAATGGVVHIRTAGAAELLAGAQECSLAPKLGCCWERMVDVEMRVDGSVGCWCGGKVYGKVVTRRRASLWISII